MFKVENPLEGPTELTEGCILIVMVRQARGYGLKSAKGRHTGRSPEKHPEQGSQASHGVRTVSLPASVGDDMLGVLTGREAPLSLAPRILLKNLSC